MRYMLMIYEDESVYGDAKGNALLSDIVAKHGALARDLGPRLIAGAGLGPSTTATTLRTARGKQALHDGPFAEAREQLGGFYLVDVQDLDEALAIARRIPLPGDGAIEVRPALAGA